MHSCKFTKCNEKIQKEFKYCKKHIFVIKSTGLCYNCLNKKDNIAHRLCHTCHLNEHKKLIDEHRLKAASEGKCINLYCDAPSHNGNMCDKCYRSYMIKKGLWHEKTVLPNHIQSSNQSSFNDITYKLPISTNQIKELNNNRYEYAASSNDSDTSIWNKNCHIRGQYLPDIDKGKQWFDIVESNLQIDYNIPIEWSN
jgi:hypothetical protein